MEVFDPTSTRGRLRVHWSVTSTSRGADDIENTACCLATRWSNQLQCVSFKNSVDRIVNRIENPRNKPFYKKHRRKHENKSLNIANNCYKSMCKLYWGKHGTCMVGGNRSCIGELGFLGWQQQIQWFILSPCLFIQTYRPEAPDHHIRFKARNWVEIRECWMQGGEREQGHLAVRWHFQMLHSYSMHDSKTGRPISVLSIHIYRPLQ
jgi:hypothetical protein